MHGDIVYLELSLNPQKCEQTLSFYEQCFQWKFEESFLTDKRYFMFDTPSHQQAGALDENAKGSHIGIQLYIEVSSIEELLERIQKFHPEAMVLQGKTKISDEYGYYAFVMDPSMNRIGLQESFEKKV